MKPVPFPAFFPCQWDPHRSHVWISTHFHGARKPLCHQTLVKLLQKPVAFVLFFFLWELETKKCQSWVTSSTLFKRRSNHRRSQQGKLVHYHLFKGLIRVLVCFCSQLKSHFPVSHCVLVRFRWEFRHLCVKSVWLQADFWSVTSFEEHFTVNYICLIAE